MPVVALVVDDSMVIRHTVCRFLEERGFAVEAASNGMEALDILNRVLPGLVITDMQMPAMGGSEFISALKDKPQTASIPIVILTGRSSGFDQTETRAEFTIGTFKAHAERVRAYMEDPSIGGDRVESILDAAHALSLQRRRNLAVKKLSPEEERQQLLSNAQPAADPFKSVHRRPEYVEPDLQKVPLSPEPDILLFDEPDGALAQLLVRGT